MDQLKFILLILSLGLIGTACQKESFIDSSSAKLKFSAEEVFFDTVFETQGSSTRRFKVYNPHNQKIKIDKIQLSRGTNSPYKINIDGQPASEISNYTLRANDSMYIFAEVKINPHNNGNPFLVKDSISFITNGNQQFMNLVAYGREAYIHDSTSISNASETWQSDLPHLIVDYLIVDSNSTLTIPEGTEVYSTGGASLFVFGSLKVDGSNGNPVTFEGARPEESFAEEPGQWQGIHLLPSSKDNIINHALVTEGTVGIRADSSSVNQNPKLDLRNSRIRNMATAGIQGFSSDIVAINTIISNSCGHLVSGRLGGNYSFFHCTLVASSCKCSPQDPAIYFDNNPFEDEAGNQTYFDLNLSIFNSIVWGNKDEEIAFALSPSEKTDFNAGIQNSVLKTENEQLDVAGNILNEDPFFLAVCDYDFTVESGSPLLLNGASLDSLDSASALKTALESDINERQRNNDKPDIGAIEMEL